MIAYKTKEVHKSDIKPGDTILCPDGNLRTVCKKDIKRNNFTGITIFGDPYKSGYQPVKKALIEKSEPRFIRSVNKLKISVEINEIKGEK